MFGRRKKSVGTKLGESAAAAAAAAAAAPSNPKERRYQSRDDVGEMSIDNAEDAAVLWAMDHGPEQRWEDEAEIDYTQLQQQASADKRMPSLFNYSNSSSHRMKFLGMLKSVQGRLPPQEGRTDLLETIDLAQRQGKLPWMSSDEDERVVSISRYGMKVMDCFSKQVHMRHPLHRIASIIFYEDGFGKNMLAFKIGAAEEEIYDCYIYECESEKHAKDICLTLAQAFDAVYQRNTLEGQ
ncbi:integrin beta-1-binding protein 1-like [Oscarella lobularis]|uniref:integrin beta-1-binding protein 1-like n=1 Tax=Oscarella lobularis TaxID=121494 RepID=UPI003313FE46